MAEKLSELVQSLDAEGRFTNKKELKGVLTDYAKRTMGVARKTKKKEESRAPEAQTGLGSQKDSSDMVGTFKLIKSAVGHSTRRELVHLLDARRAVCNALDKAVNQGQNDIGYEVGDEFGEEAAEKTQEERGVIKHLGIGYHLYFKEKA